MYGGLDEVFNEEKLLVDTVYKISMLHSTRYLTGIISKKWLPSLQCSRVIAELIETYNIIEYTTPLTEKIMFFPKSPTHDPTQEKPQSHF